MCDSDRDCSQAKFTGVCQGLPDKFLSGYIPWPPHGDIGAPRLRLKQHNGRCKRDGRWERLSNTKDSATIHNSDTLYEQPNRDRDGFAQLVNCSGWKLKGHAGVTSHGP